MGQGGDRLDAVPALDSLRLQVDPAQETAGASAGAPGEATEATGGDSSDQARRGRDFRHGRTSHGQGGDDGDDRKENQQGPLVALAHGTPLSERRGGVTTPVSVAEDYSFNGRERL